MTYNEILEIRPINEEIWIVHVTKQEDKEFYYCDRVVGIAKFKEIEKDNVNEDYFWTFCTYDLEIGAIEVSNNDSTRAGIIYGRPTTENILHCIEHKGHCKANIGGFKGGDVKDL